MLWLQLLAVAAATFTSQRGAAATAAASSVLTLEADDGVVAFGLNLDVNVSRTGPGYLAVTGALSANALNAASLNVTGGTGSTAVLNVPTTFAAPLTTTAAATTTLNGAAVLNGVSTFNAAATFNQPVSVTTITGGPTAVAGLTVSGVSFKATAGAAVSGAPLTASAGAAISGGTLSASALSVSGTTALSGAVTATAGAAVSGAPLTASAGAAISGGTLSASALSVSGTTALSGAVTATAGVTVSGGTLSAGTLSVTGSATVSGTLNLGNAAISGTLTVAGATTHTLGVTFNGGATFTGVNPMDFSGSSAYATKNFIIRKYAGANSISITANNVAYLPFDTNIADGTGISVAPSNYEFFVPASGIYQVCGSATWSSVYVSPTYDNQIGLVTSYTYDSDAQFITPWNGLTQYQSTCGTVYLPAGGSIKMYAWVGTGNPTATISKDRRRIAITLLTRYNGGTFDELSGGRTPQQCHEEFLASLRKASAERRAERENSHTHRLHTQDADTDTNRELQRLREELADLKREMQQLRPAEVRAVA